MVISTKTVDRPNDRLVMSGWLKNNSQSANDPEGYCVISPSGENNISTIKLVRVDARVTFNISLDKQSDRTNIIEKSFTPLKFIVKNVPTKAYLYGKADNELVSGCEYFSSNNGEFANFETKDENGVSSFTFYMMENKQSTIGLNDYNQREKEKKNPLNYEYEYAPATATLVEMTGSYYEKYTDRDGSIKERHADVKYTVHLGYVGGDANDFRCQRNTTYIYNVYMASDDDSYEADRELWRKLYKTYIFNNDSLDQVLEDQSLYWNDDKEIVDTFVLKTIKRFDEKKGANQELLPEFKDDEDQEFARRLFRRTILNSDYYRHLISENTKNWDLDRIAFMDIIIMQTALAEILSFPNIPVSVSLNEYVEIAKLYSTAKSGSYINGTLDGIVNQINKEGKLTKN